ncbi:MAG: archease [Candidatus Odinarchaeia archaeon]
MLQSEGFEFLPHTSDVYIKAWGKNLNEAFKQAGRALFQIVTDIDKISVKTSYTMKIEAEDLHALLFEFIRELLYVLDVKKLVFSDFEVKITEKEAPDEGYVLECKCFGEKLDAEKHPRKTEIKAPTYSQMKIETDRKPNTLYYVVDI